MMDEIVSANITSAVTANAWAGRSRAVRPRYTAPTPATAIKPPTWITVEKTGASPQPSDASVNRATPARKARR